ncbi:ATP-binding protein [Sphingomonas sp. BIUV-7]|uniref:ATP-binding protein n=1 Tax=Sphingomonas natans TaxID=3063330 RepID=A0ABT8YEV5_9SPHN|nr:ATP-binding protein [Sphingomonas sp. BIUV-7]MDO6416115.1 ATP-binding protein [Sphingomonas sp. BIUV-7]
MIAASLRTLREGTEPAPAAETALLVAHVARRVERVAWVATRGGAAAGDDRKAETAGRHDDDARGKLDAAVEKADAALASLPDGRFAEICRRFGIVDAERDLLATALAAQLDPALLLLFHQLQGRPWTTEPLVARLFDHGHRALLRADGPATVWRLLIRGEAALAEPPPLGADPVLPHWLDNVFPFDSALVGHVRGAEACPPLDDWPLDATVARVRALSEAGLPVRLIVQGVSGGGRSTFAAAAARALGRSGFVIESIPHDMPWPLTWTLIQRHAVAAGAMPIWHGPPSQAPSVSVLAPIQAVCLSPGEAALRDPRVVDVQAVLPTPSRDTRLRLVGRLVPASAAWSAADSQRLADRPGLAIGDIAALGRARLAGPAEAEAFLRNASVERLGDLAQRLPTTLDWDDLVLPRTLFEGLRDLAFEARTRAAFWDAAELQRLFPAGRGLVSLFSGPPGTGKTMAAQVIARDLGVDLYRIDLATLMSKYIGETAKNLRTVFTRAADVHAVLLFDEADALFANRTEVKDSHDRYANTDTNYLLQQLEAFEGVAVLATNRKANIDTAFLRRISYAYDFPRPEAADRRRLWAKLAHPILGGIPLASAATLDAFGDHLELSGAQIKNALVAAHFAAKRRGGEAGAADLVIGVGRELAKEGRSLSPRERQRLSGHG